MNTATPGSSAVGEETSGQTPARSPRDHWRLDPAVTFLNHGSFGATPIPVLAAQTRMREAMEREPVQFLWRQLPALLNAAREACAAFLHADPAGFAFVPNATTAVNTVLRSLDWRPGDRILTSDHVYPAVLKSMRALGARSGVELDVVPVPFPLHDAEPIVAAFEAGFTDRTRLVLVDHIASATAVIFPVEQIVERCRERGVLSFVDAAHAPGMVPIDLDALNPDFWTGNFHKWLCAPKGAAGLFVSARHRDRIHPLVTSHGYDTGFHGEFDWTGTADPTAYLGVPEAIAFLSSFGWPYLQCHNHGLALHGRRVVSDALGTVPPVAEHLHGSMALAALPEKVGATQDEVWQWQHRLFDRTRIEVPFTVHQGRPYVRLSAHIYNRPEEYERLAAALVELFRD